MRSPWVGRSKGDGPLTHRLEGSNLSPEELSLLQNTAQSATMYIETLTQVGNSNDPDAAIPVLLLAASDVAATAARLGTADDVPLPATTYDHAEESNFAHAYQVILTHLAELDVYTDVVDPVISSTTTTASLAKDLTEIADSLEHGLDCYHKGDLTYALWWWQYSCLTHWGERCLAAARTLSLLVSHLRVGLGTE